MQGIDSHVLQCRYLQSYARCTVGVVVAYEGQKFMPTWSKYSPKIYVVKIVRFHTAQASLNIYISS